MEYDTGYSSKHLLTSHWYPEDEDNMFLQNVVYFYLTETLFAFELVNLVS